MDEWEDFSRRTALLIPTLLGAVTLAFLIIHLAPGDPVEALMGDYDAPIEEVQQLRRDYGLDKPLFVQYGIYILKIVQGDFGKSLRTERNVMSEILRVFPHTLYLALLAVTLSVIMGVPLGVLSALRSNSAVDHFSRFFALLGVSMPSFWLALILLLFLSVYTGWFPLVGAGQLNRPLSILHHLFLPALALALRDTAVISRLTRSGVLETMKQDYILTARAKGLSEGIVTYKHVLKNTLLPIITVVALDLGNTLGGTVVIETVFNRPGLGSLIIQSIHARDYPQLQGAILFFAFCFAIVNLCTDFIYKLVDPRVEFRKTA